MTSFSRILGTNKTLGNKKFPHFLLSKKSSSAEIICGNTVCTGPSQTQDSSAGTVVAAA